MRVTENAREFRTIQGERDSFGLKDLWAVGNSPELDHRLNLLKS